MDCEEFQGLADRVTNLETIDAPTGSLGRQLKEEWHSFLGRVELLGTSEAPGGSVGLQGSECEMELLMERMHQLMERVGDLKADGPKGTTGAGVQLPPKSPNRPVLDAKVISNVNPLTEKKSAFRR